MASTVFSNNSDQNTYDKIYAALRFFSLEHLAETIGRSIPLLAAAIDGGVTIDDIKKVFPDPGYLQFENLLRQNNAASLPMQQLVEFWIATNPNANPSENLTYASILKHAVKPGHRLSPLLESWLDTIALKQQTNGLFEYLSDIYKATGKNMLQWLQDHAHHPSLSFETLLLAAVNTQEPQERILNLLNSVMNKKIESINALLQHDVENHLFFSKSQSSKAIHDVVNPIWMFGLNTYEAVYAEAIYKCIHEIKVPEQATLQDTVNMLTSFAFKGNSKHPLWDTGAILLYQYVKNKNEPTEEDIATYEGQMVSALLEIFKLPPSHQERYFNAHTDIILHYLRTVPDSLSSIPLGMALQAPLLRPYLLENDPLCLSKKLAAWFLRIDSNKEPNVDSLFIESLVKSIEVPCKDSQSTHLTYDTLRSIFLQGLPSIEDAQKHYHDLSELSGMEIQDIAANVLFQHLKKKQPLMPIDYSFGI